MKEETQWVLTPLIEDMKYDQNCWLAIDVKTDSKPEVIFYQPQADENNTFSSLKEFAKNTFEDNFTLSSTSGVELDLNDNKSTISGCDVKEIEDVDEENHRVLHMLESKGQIIDVYKNIPEDKISDLVKEALKDLKSLEINAKEIYQENKNYTKDPNAYYGVSRHD